MFLTSSLIIFSAPLEINAGEYPSLRFHATLTLSVVCRLVGWSLRDAKNPSNF
jgi:hypothetical protein